LRNEQLVDSQRDVKFRPYSVFDAILSISVFSPFALTIHALVRLTREADMM